MNLIKGKASEIPEWLIRFADVHTQSGFVVVLVGIIFISIILFIFKRRKALFKTLLIMWLLFLCLALTGMAQDYIDTQTDTLTYQSHETVAKVLPERTIIVHPIPETVGNAEKVRVRDVKFTHHKKALMFNAKEAKGLKKGDRVTLTYQDKYKPYEQPNRVDYLNKDKSFKHHLDLDDIHHDANLTIEPQK